MYYRRWLIFLALQHVFSLFLRFCWLLLHVIRGLRRLYYAFLLLCWEHLHSDDFFRLLVMISLVVVCFSVLAIFSWKNVLLGRRDWCFWHLLSKFCPFYTVGFSIAECTSTHSCLEYLHWRKRSPRSELPLNLQRAMLPMNLSLCLLILRFNLRVAVERTHGTNK